MRKVVLTLLIGLFALVGVCTTCTVAIVIFSEDDEPQPVTNQPSSGTNENGAVATPVAPVDSPEPTLIPSPAATPRSTATPSPPTATASPSTQFTLDVSPIPDGLPLYDRNDWRHWIDADSDCQDTRQEVLVAESLVEVSFQDDRACRVVEGSWYAAYTGTTVTDPGNLDIDHLVPLANAHQSGAWAWSSEQKRSFANSLDDPDHLIAVTARANRSKGAKGPEEWRPPDESYWCEYATDWIRVKQEWGLSATPAEANALREMLIACAEAVDLTITESETPAAIPPPTATPTVEPTEIPTSSRTVYASCDEAEGAGEERMQGSSGPGQGFPTWMVPSARDGDGDGVVCEK